MTTELESWVPSFDTFGKRLAAMRADRHWTVKRAAEVCGISERTWAYWEKGGEPQRMEKVARQIAERAGISYIWLLAGPRADMSKSSRRASHQRVPVAV